MGSMDCNQHLYVTFLYMGTKKMIKQTVKTLSFENFHLLKTCFYKYTIENNPIDEKSLDYRKLDIRINGYILAHQENNKQKQMEIHKRLLGKFSSEESCLRTSTSFQTTIQ